MKKAQAQQQIYREWLNFKNKDDPLLFYGWLQKHRPDLLKFKSKDEKYLLIASWVDRWRYQERNGHRYQHD